LKLLTEDAVLICKHPQGRVKIETGQNLVTIHKRRVLVQSDPEGKEIKGCANVSAINVPCTLTLAVRAGYSGLLRIKKKPVCLDTVTGLTNGQPPGTFSYVVSDPGQQLVTER